MDDEELHNKIEDLHQQIFHYKNLLTVNNSDIGDYKIIKTYEARLLGEDDPYDTADLIAQRQAARDKINELSAQLKELEEEEYKQNQAATPAQ